MKAYASAVLGIDDSAIGIGVTLCTAEDEAEAIGLAFKQGKRLWPNRRIEIETKEITREVLKAMLEAVDKEAT